MLDRAQQAYHKKNKSKGARLVDEILKQEFNHPGAWDLLFKVYGTGQTFEAFRREFAHKYYPDQAHLLRPMPAALQKDTQPRGQVKAATVPPPEKKRGLFGLFSRKPSTPAEPTPLVEQPQAPTPLPAAPVARQEAEKQAIVPFSAEKPAAPAATGDLPKVRVMVVDDIAQTRENVIRTLRFQREIEVVGTATNGAQAIQVAKDVQPDVILMDINMPDMDGIAATAAIKKVVPFTQIIILTVQDDMDYMREAMMAGARDFLTKPPMIDDLLAAVQKASEYARLEKAKAPRTSAQQEHPVKAAHGKIITIYSPRGGAGCTMLAANLGAALHSEESRVIIVDGSLQYGDIPALFDVIPKNTLLDLTPRSSELDTELVDTVVIHHSSGIHLLAAPLPAEAEQVTGQQFSDLLLFLSEQYSYVIVDTAHRLSDTTLAAFDASHLVITITTQDVPSIARLRKFLELAPALNLDQQRLLVIMNSFDPQAGVLPEKVADTFKIEIPFALPLAREVVTPSINRGIPLMLRKELAARSITDVISNLAEAAKKRLNAAELPPTPAEIRLARQRAPQ
ncbi:MAG: response regulator [Anaerolineales bacterium]|nr:response regulator [Anaerolineales bacterium]